MVAVAAELTTGEDVLKGFTKRSLGIHSVGLDIRSSGSYCVPTSCYWYFKITKIILGFLVLGTGIESFATSCELPTAMH